MCIEIINVHTSNSDFRQKTMVLTNRILSGLRLQNKKGEKLLHLYHLWMKALNELNKFHIVKVRCIHFENLLRFT